MFQDNVTSENNLYYRCDASSYCRPYTVNSLYLYKSGRLTENTGFVNLVGIQKLFLIEQSWTVVKRNKMTSCTMINLKQQINLRYSLFYLIFFFNYF